MKYTIGSLIVKIVNICNLNCSYCYVFNSGDDHYQGIPNKMSETICEQLLLRIKEHCLAHNLNRFTVVFHGGEPLLLGIPYYERFLHFVDVIFKDTNIHLACVMQSNGTLMTEEWAKFLIENKIHVGFSVDGYEAIHNENRIYRSNGKGSYQDVIKGINIYKKYAVVNALSVINPESDPILFYKTIKDVGFQSVGVLLRDQNYSNVKYADMQATASWLIKLFDIWFEDKQKGNLKMLAPFTTLINLLLGIDWVGNDAYGEALNNALLVLTNGEIQVTGVEKPNKFSKTYFVQNNKLDDVFKKKIFRDYYNLHQNTVLCEQCKNCLIKTICGGGRYSHRYSSVNGFNNPTIYCDVMKQLITHIQNRIVTTLPKSLKNKLQLKLIDNSIL